MERNTPRLGRPKSLVPLRNIPIYPMANEYMKSSRNNMEFCQMDSCFDYSLCPVSSKFYFYMYRITEYVNATRLNIVADKDVSNPKSEDRVSSLQDVLRNSQYFTRDYLKACLFVVLIEDCDVSSVSQIHKLLSHWFGDGRNHVLWFTCRNSGSYKQILQSDFLQFFGRAIIATETAYRGSIRPNFDLIVSHWKKTLPNGEIWTHLPPIVPAKRKYLATYLGKKSDIL